MSVTRRPNEDALLTGIGVPALFGIRQLYALCVCPLMTMSTLASRLDTMSTIAPDMPVQESIVVGLNGAD